MADAEPPAAAEPEDDENALEGAETDGADALETPEVTDATSANGGDKSTAPAPKKSGGIKQVLRKFNIYLLLFVFILVIAGGILVVAYFQSKKAATTSTLQTETLTQNTLQQIAASDSTVGSSTQVLNVQSSAVFAGRVLIRQGLEVAANLQVGGTTALTELTVSGTSQLGQVQVGKNLAVNGDLAVQGAVTIAKSLQVNGGGTFSGALSSPQITTTNFQLNGDLVLTHHVIAGGPSPNLTRGSALGGGGTASVGGSDTAGSVSINLGSGPSAGCFATIEFATKYNSPPHVLLTPVGSSAAVLDYYVTRTSTSFSICDASVPSPGTSFAFDYFIIN